MKKSIAEKWVEALRSGYYKQGRGCLSVNKKHCCLGVLCDIAMVEGIVDFKLGENYNYYDGMCGVLPLAVSNWAGISTNTGNINHLNRTLADLNDSYDYSFNKIADAIEKHYKEL
jgi:hypothetical protein